MNHHFHCNLNRFYPTQIDFREAFLWSDAKVLSFSFWISEKMAAQLGQIRCERRDIFIHCPLLWLFWSETNADVADDWLYASGLPLIFTYKVILDHNVTINEQNREEDKYKINRVHWFSSDMRMYCFCGVWDKQRKKNDSRKYLKSYLRGSYDSCFALFVFFLVCDFDEAFTIQTVTLNNKWITNLIL